MNRSKVRAGKGRFMLHGFGIENLGIAALRRPIASSIIIAAITLMAVLGLFRLGYSGANVDILRDGSQEITDYDELLNSFRNFNNDAVVLMRGKSLATIEGIETYRDLSFEFQFDERVASVLSIFSLVRYKTEEGGWQSAIPARFESDAEVKSALEELVRDIPNANSLFNPDGKSAVMVIYVKPEAVQDAKVQETVRRFQEIARSFETEELEITIAGQPAIRSDLIDSILDDMLRLLPIAAVFCTIVAFAILRSIGAVIVIATAPVLSLIWLLGGMGLAGIEINFLTNILPVLVIVVVFADTLHLFIKWAGLVEGGMDAEEALDRTVRLVGPACALSALTTAIALFSLVLSGNDGLTELGIVGGIAMLASLIAVLAATPLALHWAIRLGFRMKHRGATRLAAAATPAIWLSRYPFTLLVLGLVLAIAGLYAHFTIESRFALVDYLAQQSEVAQSENFIDDAYPGSTPLFAIVRLDRSLPLLDQVNLDRFYETLGAVGEVFPATSFYSLADFRDEIEKGGGSISESDFDALPEYLTSRFISPVRDRALITIFSSANLEAAAMRGMVRTLQEKLAERGLAEHVAITGYPVLSAIVAPRLMDNLRFSLIAAIGLTILLIMLASRSIRLGLACLVPNLLPVITVELVLWLAGIPLNMSVTVALTVAFGLAVNDSIHLLNQYLHSRQSKNPEEAMDQALRLVLPALLSTTLILVGGLAIMLTSSLPVIALFSAVMIFTLLFAILFDVLQLPAHILLLAKSEGRVSNAGD